MINILIIINVISINFKHKNKAKGPGMAIFKTNIYQITCQAFFQGRENRTTFIVIWTFVEHHSGTVPDIRIVRPTLPQFPLTVATW